MWFQGATTAATRQFQLARLLAELAAPDALYDHGGRAGNCPPPRRGA